MGLTLPPPVNLGCWGVDVDHAANAVSLGLSTSRMSSKEKKMAQSVSAGGTVGVGPRLRRWTTLGVGLGVLASAAFLVASPASAARPKPAPSSSLTLVLVDPADGVANWGDQVRFNVSTTATTEPHVSLKCYQNSSLVYTAQTGYYASYPWPDTQTFTLSSGAWTGGAASCTAVLYWFNATKTVTGATLNFPVAA
jgi:hypothetical protein